LTALWTSIICSKPKLSIWHSKSCLQADCLECGVSSFKKIPQDLQYENLIHWKSTRYEVVGKIDVGKNKKVHKVEYHETQPKELLKYLNPHLKEFVLHNYVFRWQDLQFKECLQNFTHDEIMSCVDFSKNYTLKIQNEIQSMHWHNFQVSILG
jgi:hypothetical protein